MEEDVSVQDLGDPVDQAQVLVDHLNAVFGSAFPSWQPIAIPGIEVVIEVVNDDPDTDIETMTLRPTGWPSESTITCKVSRSGRRMIFTEGTVDAPHIGFNNVGFKVTSMDPMKISPIA